MKNPVIVVGGGISGLTAAIELQKKGVPYILLEKSDRIGGRVATDEENGFLFDRGFQVFQTAYPEAKRYLNSEKLNLKPFKPGARIFTQGNWQTVSDPFRDFGAFFETLFSGVGTVKDKWLILKLRSEMRSLQIERLFEQDQESTRDYILKYGFSEEFYTQFFQPFFAGIFLESDLSTSSDAFRFIFKMFTEGDAAVPAQGMAQIALQLASQLHPDSIQLNTQVQQCEETAVILTDGTRLEASAVIQSGLVETVSTKQKQQSGKWNGTDCYYFQVPDSIPVQPYLMLNSLSGRTINHIAFLSDIAPTYAPIGKRLASVTLASLQENKTVEERLVSIQNEINQLFPKHSNWKFLKRYAIPKSLPVKKHIKPGELKNAQGLYIAGDEQYFGSVNFAMQSGRQVAQAIMETLAY